MNLLTAIGNIGRDAEIKYTAKGDAVASFSFALSSGYGEKAITTWINATIFGKRGETLAPMLLKGTKIGISGEFQARPYTAKDGTEKLSLEMRVNDVTLLGKKTATTDESTDDMSQPTRQPVSKPSANFDDFEDDIPF